MAYSLFTIEYSKYQYRKYMRSKQKILLDQDKLKNLYLQLRSKHNAQQLEFPFVKEIDEQYINAKYNLLETNL